MKDPEGHAAENEQGQDIRDRRDKGIGKYGRVDVDCFCEDRDAAADNFGDDDGECDCRADRKRIQQSVVIAE